MGFFAFCLVWLTVLRFWISLREEEEWKTIFGGRRRGLPTRIRNGKIVL